MFKGFNKHELLVRKYKQEVEGWFPLQLDDYTPENADDLDEYYYKACYCGEGHDIAPHDMQRDEAWNEAVEEVFESKGGYADWYDGSLFYVQCHKLPHIPAVLSNVIITLIIITLKRDLLYGPLYLDKHGNCVSMFDTDYDHAFDFKRAADLVINWFDDKAPNNDWIRKILGDELFATIR